MNETLMVELLRMAPDEPVNMAIWEWHRQFERDYPKPWAPTNNEERSAACRATHIAKTGNTLPDICFDRESYEGFTEAGVHWKAWRHELFQQFIADYPYT